MKARIKFSKCGSMRFVGHLDVMRYFQKAFRRAGIPIQYSQGYSPHPLMSFASPLGIGLSSDAEYMDLALETCRTSEQMVAWMNSQMNEEIRVREFTVLKENAKTAMAMLAACDYAIAVKQGKDSFLRPERFGAGRKYSSLSSLLEAFLGQEEIVIRKKTKRSEKLVDIRDYIYVLTGQVQAFDEQTVCHSIGCLDPSLYTPVLFLQLTAGSVINIKPELVLQALADYAGEPFDPYAYQIHRMEMYGDADGCKGEVHTRYSETPCRLVPLSEYDREPDYR